MVMVLVCSQKEGKNFGLSNYMKATKKKLDELTSEDIQILIQYPKKVGQHKKKDVMLYYGIYGIYMKYNEKNYRIDKLKDHSLSSLSKLLK